MGDNDIVQHIEIDMETAAQQATSLVKIIDNLVASFENVDGNGAEEIRNQLIEMSKVIKDIDIERLRHLDGIVENIAKSAEKLPVDQFKELSDGLKEVGEKAKEVQKSFEGINNVSVKLTQGKDESDSDFMDRRISAIQSSSSTVDRVKRYREELRKLPGDYTEINKQLSRVLSVASHTGPDSVGRMQDAIAELNKEFARLPDAAKSALAESQSSVISAAKSISDYVVTPESTKGVENIKIATDLIDGNMSSLSAKMLDLVKNSKTFSGLMGDGAVSAAGIAAAAAFAAKSLEWAWSRYKAFMSAGRDQENRYLEGMIQSNVASGETAARRLSSFREAQLRENRIYSASRSSERAERDSVLTREEAMLEAERNRALLSASSGEEIDAINERFNARSREIGFTKSRIGAADKFADSTREYDQAVAMKERQKEAMARLQKAAQAAGSTNMTIEEMAGSAVTDRSTWWGAMKGQVVSALAAIRGTSVEDEERRFTDLLSKGANAQESLNEMIAQLGKEMMDQDAVIAEASSKVKEANLEKDKISTDEKAYENERLKSVAELKARNDEAAREFEKERETNAQLIRRIEERIAIVRKESESLDAIAKQRAEQQIRALELEKRRLKRQQELDRYQTQREAEVTKRDWKESDRQLIRRISNSRSGYSGQVADAAQETAYWRDQMQRSTDALDKLLKGYTNEDGKIDIERLKRNELDYAKYTALTGDRQSFRNNLRSAMESEFDLALAGDQKTLAFRDTRRESNRLVSMGLMGGGEVRWGTETANNTKAMVDLLKEINGKFGAKVTDRYAVFSK